MVKLQAMVRRSWRYEMQQLVHLGLGFLICGRWCTYVRCTDRDLELLSSIKSKLGNQITQQCARVVLSRA